MDITEIDEQWIETPRLRNRKEGIIAISNTGKYRKRDGTVGCLELRQKLIYHGELELCYRLIAEHFLITVKRPDQICIDHITHHPTDYNVNDVRNLRWCTKKENSNFDEARENTSKSLKGKFLGEKGPMYGKGYLISGDKNPMYGMTGEKAPMYGRTGDKSPRWKGDSAKAKAKYRRALNEYRANPTQENLAALEEARLIRNEYQRHKRHLRRDKKSRQ